MTDSRDVRSARYELRNGMIKYYIIGVVCGIVSTLALLSPYIFLRLEVTPKSIPATLKK